MLIKLYIISTTVLFLLSTGMNIQEEKWSIVITGAILSTLGLLAWLSL